MATSYFEEGRKTSEEVGATATPLCLYYKFQFLKRFEVTFFVCTSSRVTPFVVDSRWNYRVRCFDDNYTEFVIAQFNIMVVIALLDFRKIK